MNFNVSRRVLRYQSQMILLRISIQKRERKEYGKKKKGKKQGKNGRLENCAPIPWRLGLLAGLSSQTARVDHLSRPVSSGKCESLRKNPDIDALTKFLVSIHDDRLDISPQLRIGRRGWREANPVRSCPRQDS